jgi:leader peptidase (prepilin peptidase)/N-methyltransferase
VEIALLSVLILGIVWFSYYAIHCKGNERPNIRDIRGIMNPRGWKQILYYILVPVSCVAVMLMLHLYYGRDAMFIIKRLLVAGMLWPVAVFDYREYRIPNKLLLVFLAVRVVLLIPELLLFGTDALGTVLTELIAAVGCTIVCVISMLISRGSLGMGDLKLMAVMAFFLGIEGVCYAMFLSVFAAFICSVGLLITKKKGRKDAIPFAPFILIGTIVSFILCGT